jgi:hypothetical protein
MGYAPQKLLRLDGRVEGLNMGVITLNTAEVVADTEDTYLAVCISSGLRAAILDRPWRVANLEQKSELVAVLPICLMIDYACTVHISFG